MKNAFLKLLLLYGATSNICANGSDSGDSDIDALSIDIDADSIDIDVDSTVEVDLPGEIDDPEYGEDYHRNRRAAMDQAALEEKDVNESDQKSSKDLAVDNEDGALIIKESKEEEKKEHDKNAENREKYKTVHEKIIPQLRSDFFNLLDENVVDFGDMHFLSLYNIFKYELSYCEKILLDIFSRLEAYKSQLNLEKSKIKSTKKSLKDANKESDKISNKNIDNQKEIQSIKTQEYEKSVESLNQQISTAIDNYEGKCRIADNQLNAVKKGSEKFIKQCLVNITNENKKIISYTSKIKDLLKDRDNAIKEHEKAKETLEAREKAANASGNNDNLEDLRKKVQSLQEKAVRKTAEHDEEAPKLRESITASNEKIKTIKVEEVKTSKSYQQKIKKVTEEVVRKKNEAFQEKTKKINEINDVRKDVDREFNLFTEELRSKIAQFKTQKSDDETIRKSLASEIVKSEIELLQATISSLTIVQKDFQDKKKHLESLVKNVDQLISYREGAFASRLNRYTIDPKIKTQNAAYRSVYKFIYHLFDLSNSIYKAGFISKFDYELYQKNITIYKRLLYHLILYKDKGFGSKLKRNIYNTLFVFRKNKRPKAIVNYKPIINEEYLKIMPTNPNEFVCAISYEIAQKISSIHKENCLEINTDQPDLEGFVERKLENSLINKILEGEDKNLLFKAGQKMRSNEMSEKFQEDRAQIASRMEEEREMRKIALLITKTGEIDQDSLNKAKKLLTNKTDKNIKLLEDLKQKQAQKRLEAIQNDQLESRVRREQEPIFNRLRSTNTTPAPSALHSPQDSFAALMQGSAPTLSQNSVAEAGIKSSDLIANNNRQVKAYGTNLFGDIVVTGFAECGVDCFIIEDDFILSFGSIFKCIKIGELVKINLFPMVNVRHRSGWGVGMNGFWIPNKFGHNIEIKINTPFYCGISLMHSKDYGLSFGIYPNYNYSVQLQELQGYIVPLTLNAGIQFGN